MTTIAYRNGVIAADTLVTSNGTVCGTETFSGIIIDGEYIITLNKDGSLDKIKSDYIAIGSGGELATGAMAYGQQQ